MSENTRPISSIVAAVKEDPGHPFYPQLAQVLVDRDRLDDAIKICSRGIAKNPLPDAYLVMAQAQIALGQPYDALDSVNYALTSLPEHPVGLRVLAQCQLALGQKHLASMTLTHASRLAPDDEEIRALLEETGPPPAPTPAAPAAAAPPPRGPEPEAAAPSADEGGWMGGDLQLDTDDGPSPDAAPTFELGSPSPGLVDAAEEEPEELLEEAALEPLEDDAAGGFEVSGSAYSLDDEAYEFDASAHAAAPAPSFGGGLDLSDDAADEPVDFGGGLELDTPEAAPSTEALDDSLFAPPATEGVNTVGLELDEAPAATQPLDGELPDEPGQAIARVDLRSGRRSPPPTPSSRGAAEVASELAEAAAEALDARIDQAKGLLEGVWPPKNPKRFKQISLTLAAALTVGIGALMAVSSFHDARYEEAFAAAREAAALDTPAGYQSAALRIEEALSHRGEAPEARALAAYVALRRRARGHAPAAMEEEIQRHLKSAEAASPPPSLAIATRALYEVALDHPGDAVVIVHRGLEAYPGDPFLLWAQARAQARVGQGDQALENLKAAYSAAQDHVPIAIDLADAYTGASKPTDAARVYDGVISRQPAHPGAIAGLLEAAHQGHFSKANALKRYLSQASQLGEDATALEQCRMHLGAARIALTLARFDQASLAERAALAAPVAPGCTEALAGYLRHRGDYHAAGQLLLSLAEAPHVQKTSAAPGFRLQAGRSLVEAGRALEAIEALAPLNTRRSAIVTARARFVSGDLPAASELIAPWIETRPIGEALALAALISLHQGDFQGAQRLAKRAVRVARRGTATDKFAAYEASIAVGAGREVLKPTRALIRAQRVPSFEARRLGAAAELAGGDLGGALEHLEGALRLRPGDLAVLTLWAEIATSERATKLSQSVSPPYSNLYTSAFQLLSGSLEEAERSLAPAAGLGELSAADALRALLAFRQAGDPRSLTRLSSAASERPWDAAALLFSGDAFLAVGDPSQAARAFSAALRARPLFVSAGIGLLEARFEAAGESEEALLDQVFPAADWVSGITQASTHLGRIHPVVAVACQAQQQIPCLNKRLQQLRGLDVPTTARAQLALGRLYELQGRPAKAVEAYQAASSLPGGGEAFLRMLRVEARSLAPRERLSELQRSFAEAVPAHREQQAARLLLSSLP